MIKTIEISNVIQYLKIEWKCPICHKINQKTVLERVTNDLSLQCDYCGKVSVWE